MAPKKLRVRRSLHEVQNDYKNGNKKELENLMRAWKGIKELPPEDPKSFYCLAGFHGEPFRGAGYGDPTYWGGYCNHGNILFPTWHRIYVLKLEEALQSIKGCESVMLPYWDETNEESLEFGIPWALTDEFFELDGEKVPNPLRSFVFPRIVKDSIQTDQDLYTKPKGYETVRYPLSGLVGKDYIDKTIAHNAKFNNYKTNVKFLNRNIVDWLDNTVILPKGSEQKTGVLKQFQDCLKAPNYTVFSNSTSSGKWNEDKDASQIAVPLEAAHNHIHLAVGGFEIPKQGNYSPIPGANGDMGENNTASFDPIFYFHHCNVDRIFWIWQKQHGFTDKLEIIEEYPGTNSSDSQGATPGTIPNSWLDMKSPLNPFKLDEGKTQRVYTSEDCVNIEKQLGFTYSKGSLDEAPQQRLLKKANNAKVLKVTKINRAPMRGSFLVNAFAEIDGEKFYLGTESVLSRWNVTHCANCQTHMEVKAFFGLDALPKEILSKATFDVEIQDRSDDGSTKRLKGAKTPDKPTFQIEIV